MFLEKLSLTFLNVVECSGEMFGANREMFVNHFQLKAAKYPGRRKTQALNKISRSKWKISLSIEEYTQMMVWFDLNRMNDTLAMTCCVPVENWLDLGLESMN